MKKALAAVVLLVGGLLGYNFLTTGQLNILPGKAKSGDEQAVADLQSRFDAARGRLAQAERAAGLTGTDSTSDADAAMQEVDRVSKELQRLRPTLTSESARRQAEQLDDAIRQFRKERG